MNPASRMLRKWRYGDEIIVVSGLPRSGTSMLMKMLDAGGVAPAKYELVFNVEGQSFNRRIVVDPEMTHVAPSVYRASDIRTLGYPAQPALAGDSPVSSITVGYPRARGEFAGLSSASWLLFMFTLILGFAMRGMFGVTF